MERPLFTEIDPAQITDNPFTAFGTEWGLLAAGDEKKMNMMTIGWATLGVMWKRPVCCVFVRPVRHTYRFMEEQAFFSVGFFPAAHRKTLQLCGSISGRDGDKIAESGLTPLHDEAAPYFAESRLVLFCRKIYHHDVDPAKFIDPSIDENYPAKDYHRVYVGEITKVLTRRG